jgi:hypothetical protein
VIWIRFTIGRLMAVIVFIAISFASLMHPSDLVAKILLNMVLIFFSTSVLCAFFRTDRERAFWAGFSLFGWISLILSLGIPHLTLITDLRNYLYFPRADNNPIMVMPLSFSVAFDSLASIAIAFLGGILGLFIQKPKN